MLRIIAENKHGDQINLTSNPDYQLLQVTGLTPPTAVINTSKVATTDGSKFNSSSLDTRNIVLTIAPRGNVEGSRINLYKCFKSKQYIKLHLINGRRKVWIEGYIDNMDGDLYSNPQIIQVSIICPDPYFKDENEENTKFSDVMGAFTFPFSVGSEGVELSTISGYSERNIYNGSDDEVGTVIELMATGAVTDPTIYNLTTGESITIEYEMSVGDKIIINTRRGEKSVKAIVKGIESNIINSMTRASKWLTLLAGDNICTYTCVSGAENLIVNINYQSIYEGV